MASDPRTVSFIVDQACGAGEVTARAMFGEYGLYLDGRMVALVCDDRLYVKPTAAARGLAPEAGEGPPYPGAKPHLVLDAEFWEDGERLAELLRRTAKALPPPRAKPARKTRG